jgi:hypothetical protein
MKRLPEGRWTPVPLLAIVAVLIGGGAYALGDGGSGDGTITACVHKQGGALYVARGCAKTTTSPASQQCHLAVESFPSS